MGNAHTCSDTPQVTKEMRVYRDPSGNDVQLRVFVFKKGLCLYKGMGPFLERRISHTSTTMQHVANDPEKFRRWIRAGHGGEPQWFGLDQETAEGYARDYANKFHSPGWVIRMELAKDVALIAITAHNVKRLSTFNIPNLNFAMGVQNGVISRNSTFEFDRVFAQNLCARFPDLAGYYAPSFQAHAQNGVFHKELMLCNAAETVNFISNRLVLPIKRERNPSDRSDPGDPGDARAKRQKI